MNHIHKGGEHEDHHSSAVSIAFMLPNHENLPDPELVVKTRHLVAAIKQVVEDHGGEVIPLRVMDTIGDIPGATLHHSGHDPLDGEAEA